MKKLIIIPAYNEAESIEATVRGIQAKMSGFDYVVINDCSTDKTREICEKNGFNVVNLSVNLGIGGAVQTGYIYARDNGYEIAVQMDGDGQHDVEFVQEMASHLENNGLDLVIGSRFINKEGFQSSRLRRIGISYFKGLIRLCTGKTITDPTSGYRMAGRRVIEMFADDYPKDYPEPETAVKILRAGLKVEEIPVVMRERQGGVSSISMGKSIYYMIKVTLAIIIERLR
ncbi:MAG: glycosyltransferase family 2 protein [Clostridia bacterium]|nr:glycosyltransferase family 2 protein [Clostridia bacterium]